MSSFEGVGACCNEEECVKRRNEETRQQGESKQPEKWDEHCSNASKQQQEPKLQTQQEKKDDLTKDAKDTVDDSGFLSDSSMSHVAQLNTAEHILQ